MEVDPEPDSNIDPVDDNDTSASAESLELRQRAQQQRRRQGDAAEGPQQAQNLISSFRTVLRRQKRLRIILASVIGWMVPAILLLAIYKLAQHFDLMRDPLRLKVEINRWRRIWFFLGPLTAVGLEQVFLEANPDGRWVGIGLTVPAGGQGAIEEEEKAAVKIALSLDQRIVRLTAMVHEIESEAGREATEGKIAEVALSLEQKIVYLTDMVHKLEGDLQLAQHTPSQDLDRIQHEHEQRDSFPTAVSEHQEREEDLSAEQDPTLETPCQEHEHRADSDYIMEQHEVQVQELEQDHLDQSETSKNRESDAERAHAFQASAAGSEAKEALEDRVHQAESELRVTRKKHRRQLRWVERRMQDTKETYGRELDWVLNDHRSTLDDMHRTFLKSICLIQGRSVWMMARFRGFSQDKTVPLVDSIRVDEVEQTIEIRPESGGKNWEKFDGFTGIVPHTGDNEDVWRYLTPAVWAFTSGHPTCILFDGSSGSGKSHTILSGPDAIAERIASETFNWIRVVRQMGQPGVVAKLAFEAYTVGHTGRADIQEKTVFDTPDALDQVIRNVQSQRAKTDRNTIHNKTSSGTHLILRYLIDSYQTGRRRSSPQTIMSLCLVDLAGGERGDRDPVYIHDAEEKERLFIHDSRARLHALLLNPYGLSQVDSLTEHLKQYLCIDPSNPPPVPQKCIFFSLLDPSRRRIHKTMETLRFTKELQASRFPPG